MAWPTQVTGDPHLYDLFERGADREPCPAVIDHQLQVLQDLVHDIVQIDPGLGRQRAETSVAPRVLGAKCPLSSDTVASSIDYAVFSGVMMGQKR